MNHVYLTGFMGAGKSSVGPALAERVGAAFVDLDVEIERHENAPVSALFAGVGEDGFRDAEERALLALTDNPAPLVVACGGGVVVREANRRVMARTGTIIYLAVSAAGALERLDGAGGRPLLADGDPDAAAALLESRLPLYLRTADHIVDTVGRTIDEVVDEAAAALAAIGRAATVRVATDPGYDVVVGPGVVASLGERLATLTDGRHAMVVADEVVERLHGAAVRETLAGAGFRVDQTLVPAGERSKSWSEAGRLLEEFAAAGLDRASVVVALGGGVTGDLAGFAASAYMRGVDVVGVPTTLLGHVDSSIGGKTGVDLPAGKNLVGAFWQPRLVVSDTRLLNTLPAAELTVGLVEVAKTALLAGEEMLAALEHDVGRLLRMDERALFETVRACAAFKAGVVSADTHESDVRACLNLGHTLGHAIERVTGYGALSHGIAVAEGMRFAARIAEEVLGAPPALTARTGALLDAVGARRAAFAPDPDALIEAMRADKKNRAGQIRMVLLDAPGSWKLVGVAEDTLRRHLSDLGSDTTSGESG